jgi:hypothetical protein
VDLEPQQGELSEIVVVVDDEDARHMRRCGKSNARL